VEGRPAGGGGAGEGGGGRDVNKKKKRKEGGGGGGGGGPTVAVLVRYIQISLFLFIRIPRFYGLGVRSGKRYDSFSGIPRDQLECEDCKANVPYSYVLVPRGHLVQRGKKKKTNRAIQG